MTYPVNFTDSNKAPILVSESTETSVGIDLTLFGRAFTEYGEQLNESLLRLLENFAAPEISPNVPDTSQTSGAILSEPIEGQFWYNTTVQTMYYYNGNLTRWIPIADRGAVAANWGQILDGNILPQPVAPDGYIFPYSECIWSVAPAEYQRVIDWSVCTTNQSAQVFSQYRAEGEEKPIVGIANYLIIGIKGNRSVNALIDSYPTPTPTSTPAAPSATPAPSPTESLAPAPTVTPTPSPASASPFVGDMFVTAANGNIDVYRMNSSAVPTVQYTWNWAANKDPSDQDGIAWNVWASDDAQYVVTVHNQYVRVHTWNPATPLMTTVAKAPLRLRRDYLENFAFDEVITLNQPMQAGIDLAGRNYLSVESYLRAFEFGNNIVIIFGSPTGYQNVSTSIPYALGLQALVFNKLTNTLTFGGILNNWYVVNSVGFTAYRPAYQGNFGYQKLADKVVCLISSPDGSYQLSVSPTGGFSEQEQVPLNTGASGGQEFSTAGHAVSNSPDLIRWRSTGPTNQTGATQNGVFSIASPGSPESGGNIPGNRKNTFVFTNSVNAIHHVTTDEFSQTRLSSFPLPAGPAYVETYVSGANRSTLFNLPLNDVNFPNVYSRISQAVSYSGTEFIIFGGSVTDINSGTQTIRGLQVYSWILNPAVPSGQIHTFLTSIKNLRPPNSFYFVRRP
jgi:hypothetical protein